MLAVVVACVAAAAAAELHANPPLTAATPNRTRVHADAALLLAGLDWAGDRLVLPEEGGWGAQNQRDPHDPALSLAPRVD